MYIKGWVYRLEMPTGRYYFVTPQISHTYVMDMIYSAEDSSLSMCSLLVLRVWVGIGNHIYLQPNSGP